jgi:hypothetical protein
MWHTNRVHGMNVKHGPSDPSGGQDLKHPKPPDPATWQIWREGHGGCLAGGPTEPRFLRVSIRFCLFIQRENWTTSSNSKTQNKNRNVKLINRKASICLNDLNPTEKLQYV